MEDLTPKCVAVLNYIIEKINKSNEGKELREQVMMSLKRLQKILYICDIEYMKINNGESLFEDNYFAWSSGPVIPYVYHTFIQCQSPNGKIHPKYEE